MDGYTKAAIREALAKRTSRQVKFDDFMDRLINGPNGLCVCGFVLGTARVGDLGIYFIKLCISES